jgi:CRISPR-associated protein Csx17
LGVDRGVKEFVRHAFLVRNGLATVAVPVGRLTVPTQERPGAALLATIDRWADQLRRVKNPPAALAPALRRLDAAQYAVAAGDPQPGGSTLLSVLVAVADLEALALRSGSLTTIRPLRGIEAPTWLPLLQDGSYEFELAVALASMRAEYEAPFGVLRGLFAGRTEPTRPPVVPGFGLRPLATSLGEAHARLAIDNPPASVGRSGPRRWLALAPARTVDAPTNRVGLVAHDAGLDAVSAFVTKRVDDARLTDLLRALLLLDWRGSRHPGRNTSTGRPPTALAILAAPFHHASLPSPYHDLAEPPVADISWPRLLLAGHTERVIEDALRGLRIAGIPVGVRDAHSIASDIGGDHQRLTAACLVRLSPSAVRRALNSVVPRESRRTSDTKTSPPSEEAERS